MYLNLKAINYQAAEYGWKLKRANIENKLN